jgi:mercuric ion binding protein
MNRALAAFAVLSVVVAWTPPALSAEQTATLSVKMWCASCPYIVKRSLERVAGVLNVRVSYKDQAAVVRYDADRTSVAALTAATAEVGFPSSSVATN